MDWQDYLQRWTAAGLIDAGTAAEIQEFETAQPGARRLRWPIIIAVVFGGILLGTGLLLFVSAHWYKISPATRTATVLSVIAILHIGGALVTRFPALSITLHAVGTIALGGALAIFQALGMEGVWPTAVLIWAVGAWLGYCLLRDVPQLIIAAILTPAWIVSELLYASPQPSQWISAFVALTCIVYLSAARTNEHAVWRHALATVGAIALIPATMLIAIDPSRNTPDEYWLLAIPLIPAWILRGRESWPALGWTVWALLQAIFAEWYMTDSAFLLAGAASIAMTWWGMAELRKDRCNLGMLGFVITVLLFYFTHFVDAANSSLGLIALGIVFIAGGWQLERLRRRLMQRIDLGAPPA